MKKRMLLVDDSLLDVLLTLRAIEECGLKDECEMAADGAEAYALAVQSTFDLVLLDIKMPCIDGLALLEKLRAHAGFTTPVIILSSSNMARDHERAIALGAVDYVHKALEFSHFQSSLKQALVRHGFC